MLEEKYWLPFKKNTHTALRFYGHFNPGMRLRRKVKEKQERIESREMRV